MVPKVKRGVSAGLNLPSIIKIDLRDTVKPHITNTRYFLQIQPVYYGNHLNTETLGDPQCPY